MGLATLRATRSCNSPQEPVLLLVLFPQVLPCTLVVSVCHLLLVIRVFSFSALFNPLSIPHCIGGLG